MTLDGEHRTESAFATDTATGRYYDQRAAEYDEWYLGEGLFARRDRPGWTDDIAALVAALTSLEPTRTLDIACGTGFLTVHLPGEVTGIDQSPRMIEIAARRVPAGTFEVGDALALPYPTGSFDRAFTGHFYGHLPEAERRPFLAEAGRVAREIVVVDSAWRPGVPADGWQDRVLNDGSRHRVFKRYFTAQALADELGGEILYAGPYFVAARAALSGVGEQE